MTWQSLLLVACSVATAVLGWVTLRRSSKSDEVLDVAANIQSTFEAQKEINGDLRSELDRLREAHRLCEEGTNTLRRSLAEAYLVSDEQAREIARLKATVDEHEETITKHERTINNMLKASRHDRQP